ncbi:hypothetical protein [Rhodococcus sp. NPDC060176]|uniref:hypothetical protein n=1 Tax=Rhodococcus sp. NPDC060176 TaxID=3347062 RepID=UPI0036617F8E
MSSADWATVDQFCTLRTWVVVVARAADATTYGESDAVSTVVLAGEAVEAAEDRARSAPLAWTGQVYIQVCRRDEQRVVIAGSGALNGYEIHGQITISISMTRSVRGKMATDSS